MPKQNRVTPFGTSIASPARGMLMGNRGVLHDLNKNIVRPWQHKRWITCLLEFKGRKREIMSAGSYTELFFLDEATALAAGHRPCAECRRSRYKAFVEAWRRGNPDAGAAPKLSADTLDEYVHRERTQSGLVAVIDNLPDGVFVQRMEEPETAYLLWEGGLHAWSPEGYLSRRSRSEGEEVRVLTPASVVRVIRSGYCPDVHLSAVGKLHCG